MTIRNVELIHKEEVKPGTMVDGLPVAAQPEMFAFKVTFDEMDDENAEVIVPNDPLNAHYKEVADWYKAQKKKPFKFEF